MKFVKNMIKYRRVNILEKEIDYYKVLDDITYEICETQGNIFEYIADRQYDMQEFIPKYMMCDWTRRQMDTKYSRYQIREPEECLDFILPEIGNIQKIDGYYDGGAAFWIGFLYRAIYFATKLPSSIIIKKLPLEEMYQLYPGFHTMDEGMQLELILTSKKYNF